MKTGRPRLSDEERERRALERKLKKRADYQFKKQQLDPAYKPRNTYTPDGEVKNRNYVYKTTKTPDMSKEEYLKLITDELLEQPIPIDSPDRTDFVAFVNHRRETGIDESLDLFEKEIDKWFLE